MESQIPIHLIVLLPLVGAIINGLIGKKLSEKVIAGIGCAATFVPFLISIQAFLELRGLHGAEAVIRPAPLYTWITSGAFEVPMGFSIDRLTSVFTLFVTGVGFLIHVYSAAYMHGDEGFNKFFAYLNLFMFSMLMLITGENMLLMFVGWEGVGLCSYLLIGFWYTDDANAAAGKKAFITNRVGDFGFLLGIFFILYALDTQGLGLTLSFHELEAQQFHLGGYATIIGLLLFVGAAGKSAQIPLFVWLPDAMAGPTPVSALIHAATMVTAGVYMVARMNFIYAQSAVAMTVVACVGAATALFAATIGLVQNDIKKVLAYSTVSQLGYMFLGVGVGAFSAGVFHVVTHAFFKACLFLGAGSVIHAMHHEQDIRKMGGLWKVMPKTGWTFLICTAAIAGVPLFSGFFSKDEILWMAYSNNQTLVPGLALWIVGLLGAICTAFYMMRLFVLTFLGESRADEHTKAHLHESPALMTWPLLILAGFAAIGGVIGLPHWLGVPNLFHDWLHPVFAASEARLSFVSNPGLELGLMAIAVGLAMTSFWFAYHTYRYNPQRPKDWAAHAGGLYRLVLDKWRIDELYAYVIVNPIKAVAQFCWRVIDDGFIDGLLVNGTAAFVGLCGRAVRVLTTGDVQRYATALFLGLWAALFLWLSI